METIRDYLPVPSANPHILITSRYEQIEFTNMELDLLTDPHAYSMLTKEADSAPETDADKTAAHEVVAALNGLPLALELAGAYLKRRRIGWVAYRDLLLHDLKQALPRQLASPTRHEADLFNTLRISEQGIEEEPLLIQILDLLTWSGSAPMSTRLMAHLLNVEETSLHGALGLGYALRLLQKTSSDNRYAIHRLVQEVRRRDHPLAEQTDWVNTTTHRLGDWFESIRDDFRQLPVFEQEFEHLRAWQFHAEQLLPAAHVRLLWLQAYPAYHRGHYDEAGRIIQHALEAYANHKLDTPLLKAHLLNDLAICLSDLGKYSRALDLGNEALEIRRKLLGEKHSDIAISLSNLASYYAYLKEYLRALDLGNKAVEMRRELLGEKHPDVATSLSNLASYYSRLNDHSRALDLGNKALEIRRELLGEKHPTVAISLSNLASYYSRLDDHSRALDLGNKALETQCELLGESHPDTINSLLFVLRQLTKNSRTAGQGKALARKFLKQLPPEHPSHTKVLDFLNNHQGFRKYKKPENKSICCRQ